jgi:hypothetical protein
LESAEDRDWARVRGASDAAALQAFSQTYPGGRHAAEARRLAAGIEYERIKGSNSPEALRNFARNYPEHPFAPSAESLANQIGARAAASVEIGGTLRRYATAMQGKKIAEVLSVRELDKQQQSAIENTFRMSRSIEMTIEPAAPPQFEEALVADPAARDSRPSHAVIESDMNMVVVSGSGDARSEKRRVTVHLKRTAAGWIITSL